MFIDLQDLYNNLPVETKVTYLLSSVHNAAMEEELRQMAAVLLRRLFSTEFMEFFPKVSTCYNLLGNLSSAVFEVKPRLYSFLFE
jgi:hypothetical protein